MNDTDVLSALDVTRTFLVSQGFMREKKALHAVNGVKLSIRQGEVVGLVGEFWLRQDHPGTHAARPAAAVVGINSDRGAADW